jgi:glucose-1-phosphate thymidylyltransferase
MKALVLAGGSGTRMRPITHSYAKQLVPVAGKPVLFYGLEAIAAAGITEVGVIVGDTGEEIRAATGDGSRFGLRLTYLPQTRPLGLAHAVAVAREFLADDDFVMYLGDNFLIGGITDVVSEFRGRRRGGAPGHDAHILLSRVSEPTDFGVAELDAVGRVVGLEEKPAHPKSDLALAGIYLFSPAVHEAVAAIEPSARGELEITDALQWLIDHGRDVRSTLITGYWKDTGNVSDMLEANRSVLETIEPCLDGYVDEDSEIIGRVRIGAGAKITTSRIVGPVVIGPGTEISGCYLGPYTSVSEDCRIENSEITYSIVLRGALLSGVRHLQESLIGRNVEIAPARRAPAVHRLILGDNSKVQIPS